MINLIIHIIVSYDQNISLILYGRDGSHVRFEIRLVLTSPPRDSTLQYKRCVHLWNNFPCKNTLESPNFYEYKCGLKVGFPWNEKFREKMRNFSYVFRKLFHEISHFFDKLNEAKNAKRSEIFFLRIMRNFFPKFRLFWWIFAKLLQFFASKQNAKNAKIFDYTKMRNFV